MIEKDNRPFGPADQVGYFFGDMAGSFVNLFVDAYFLTFCTYVLGIRPAWMASLFLAARLWDAVNAPIMGSFPDRWRLGKGTDKFKPWVRLFMVPLALSGVLCFVKVPFTGKLLYVWAAFVYVLYGMSYTGTSMPYGAMASVISTDPIDRAKLSRARSIGATAVSIGAISLVPVLCFDRDSNILPERFTLLSIVFGVLSVICYLLLCRLTKERIQEKHTPGQKFAYGKVLKAIFQNRPLIGVMVATIGSMLFLIGSGQLRSYIYKEYYQDMNMMTAASLGGLPVMLLCFVLVPRVVEKFGKRKVILVMTAYNLMLSSYILFFPVRSAVRYTILNLLATIGQTVFSMLIWALVTDCLDYSEWKMNFRSDGSMYSLYTFSRKLGATFASAGAAGALAAIGYVSGSGVQQTASAVSGIYLLINAVPVIACILELVGIGVIYDLNQKETERMYAELNKRRAGELSGEK